MTDIEQKALALVNEVTGSLTEDIEDFTAYDLRSALTRAIEQHEAFRQEVSDACNAVWDLDTFGREQVKKFLSRFIIAKPDPLVEAMQEWWDADGYASIETFRAAIEKRGGKLTWGEG